MKILMVCLGNICRSPLGEGILKDLAEKKGLDWEVDSAGTGSYHIGEPPHWLSQKVAKKNGIDISAQKARQFRKEDLEKFDKIYVMDRSNYRDVLAIGGDSGASQKVQMLLNEIHPGEDRSVPDPWYGGEPNFHHAFDLIYEASEKIVEKYHTGDLSKKQRDVQGTD